MWNELCGMNCSDWWDNVYGIWLESLFWRMLGNALNAGLQNTYFTFFEFATFFRFLSLDLRFFLKKRTVAVYRQTLNRS